LTFKKYREANHKLNPPKTFIGIESGILLGHRVSADGIAVDLDKVTVILALKSPNTVKEVRGFLGMVGYYRIALPLTEVLKKDVDWHWTNRQEEAFQELKVRMVKAPVMFTSNFENEFHVIGDASRFCIGIILWQYGDNKEERPIYFSSRQISPAEKNYTTIERECLPIIFACKKFRHYLLGHNVIFHTDHDAIKYLVNKADLSGQIARWVMLLQEFQYQIKVKPGIGNKNVDYLSRLEEEAVVDFINADFSDEYLFTIEETNGPTLGTTGFTNDSVSSQNPDGGRWETIRINKERKPSQFLAPLKRSMQS
jgi:hypothetical protein